MGGDVRFHRVGSEHLCIFLRFLNYVRHCGRDHFIPVGWQSEKAEHRRVLGLPEKIRHERFEGVLPFVELDEFTERR